MSPKFLFDVILCVQPPDFISPFARKQLLNAVIGARYPNAMIWLVRDAFMRKSNSCEIHTQMRRSDRCEQYTTLRANVDLFHNFFLPPPKNNSKMIHLIGVDSVISNWNEFWHLWYFRLSRAMLSNYTGITLPPTQHHTFFKNLPPL